MGISATRRTSCAPTPSDAATLAVEARGTRFYRVAALKVPHSAGAISAYKRMRTGDLTRSVKVTTVSARAIGGVDAMGADHESHQHR